MVWIFGGWGEKGMFFVVKLDDKLKMNKEVVIIRWCFNSKFLGVLNSCFFYGNIYELVGIKCKKMWLFFYFYLIWFVVICC